MKRFLRIALLLPLAIAYPTSADDVRDARRLLCSVFETTLCFSLDGCVPMAPETLNMPRFIHVDTKTRKLSTTPSSGENRVSLADSVRRADGHVILQGLEAKRAYSLLINEQSGLATFTSAADGRSVTAFAVCTPHDKN